MMNRHDALRLLGAWARSIHKDNLLGVAALRPDRLIVTLGSAQFAFDEAQGVLMVWTVLFPDTTRLVSPDDALWRINEYAARHPETLASGRILLVDPKEKPSDPPQISLQRVFDDPAMPEATFVRAVDALSTAAYGWRRVHIERAALGLD